MDPESIADMLDVFEQRSAGSPFRSPSSVHPTPYRRHLFDGTAPSPLGTRQTPMGVIPSFTPLRKAPQSATGLQDVLALAASPGRTFMVAQQGDNAGPMLAQTLWEGEGYDESAFDAAAINMNMGMNMGVGVGVGASLNMGGTVDQWASPAKPVDMRIGHVFNMSPVQPQPTPSSSKRKLALADGLGTPRAVRTAKKMRAVTADHGGAPGSPTRRGTAPPAPLFARSVSSAHPPPYAHAQHHGHNHAHGHGRGSLVVPVVPGIQRTVSASSFVSNASTDLLSPHLVSTFDGMPGLPGLPGLPLLDASASAMPSPNLSHHSPLGTPQMGNVIFTSPEQAHGFAPDAAGGYATPSFATAGQLLGGPAAPSPALGSAAPTPTLVGHAQPWLSLGTIAETPDLVQDEIEIGELPVPLPVQGAFQIVEYPPVPGLSYVGPPDLSFAPVPPVGMGAHPAMAALPPGHPHAHAHSLPPTQPLYSGIGYGAPPHARTASGHGHGPGPHMHPHAPSFTYDMDTAGAGGMYALPPMPRSASAPAPLGPGFIGSMPSMPLPPASAGAGTSVGGLFGPGPVLPGVPYIVPHAPAPGGAHPLSPDTPRRRQASKRFGNYIKPGPKPKSKPGAGAGASASSNAAPPSSPIGSDDDRPGPDDAGPSSATTSTGTGAGAGAGAGAPLLGPTLDEFCAQIQHTQRGTIILPPTAQPVLTLAPARRADDAALSASTLPKSFIESLYATFSEFNPQTGQTAKRFRCLIEGCERSFPRKSAIHSHIQTHLEDKPFVCDKDPNCTAAFVRQHDLRRHQRIHTGEKTHNCECGKIFARGDALHRHKLRNICVGGTGAGAGAFGRPLMML
ncbi:Metallothionein expression activator [Cryptotrichosporon argae]